VNLSTPALIAPAIGLSAHHNQYQTADTRPSIIANVSGTAQEKSCPAICDFFSKPENDFATLGRQGRFLSAAPFVTAKLM
jgi:hypothetical protein